MKRLSLTLLAIVLAAPALYSAAPPIAPLKFTDTRLPNGLRVIIVEDHYAPVYSIAITYNVGSRDERKGRTGFAHLFEHMMFKGSEKVGPGEHFYLVYNNGGNMNGSTSQDRTNYFETLPKNQLDLGLFLESDRMRSLAITKENLANQISTVQEERRLGVDNQPYGRTFERMGEIVYDNFAYKHSVIGSMEDLSAATVDDVRQFFRTYYAPNNAVLTLAGDLDPADTMARVTKFFGGIPRQAPPAPVDMTEPAQQQERRETIEDRLARLPRLDMAWKIPSGNEPDYYAMRALASILGGGESSRLYQKLVKEKQAVMMAGSYAGARRGPGTMQVVAMIRPGNTLEAVESMIQEEIVKLQNEPVTESELQKTRSAARRSAVSSRESSLMRAIVLGQYAVYYDDPNLINTMLDKETAVTAADIQRVARKYLNPQQRTVIQTVPAATARPNR